MPAERFSPNAITDQQFVRIIEKGILTLPDTRTSIKSVTVNEVRHVIRELGKRKAPGYDLITCGIVKRLPHL